MKRFRSYPWTSSSDDLVSCVTCGKDQDLLDQPKWKCFKSLAKKEKKLLRIQNQANLRRYRTSPKFKFGHQTPRSNDYEHALSINKNNGNNKCTEAIKLETCQQHNYETYKDLGDYLPQKRHKKILAHFVFDVKHDGRHKEILVADENLTDFSLSSAH